MLGLVQTHHHAWLGYLPVTIVLAAVAMAAWMFLKDAAKILTDWQTGRW